MQKIAQFLLLMVAGAGLFLFFHTRNDVLFADLSQSLLGDDATTTAPQKPVNITTDLPPQPQLANPPENVKAVYATGWTAGSARSVERLIGLVKKTELNAIVIDVKDYTGEVSYRTSIPAVEEYGKDREIKIAHPNTLIKELHDNGIYVIGRITIFQDPILAAARPDLALTSSTTGKQWKDNKGVMWLDAAGKGTWDYDVAIAKDALARGFDEVNFDYIRFPSDGNLKDIKYPFWDQKTPREQVIANFWRYLRTSLPDAQISADIFGLTTVNHDDLGIGQNIDLAFHYFNAISPMVYPSHYAKGFDGFSNPAAHPYGVVYDSMASADQRLKVYIAQAANSTSTEKYLVKNPKLRPWLQDFDLGATYTPDMVQAQFDAVYAAAGLCGPISTTTPKLDPSCSSGAGGAAGWMIWDPANKYAASGVALERLAAGN